MEILLTETQFPFYFPFTLKLSGVNFTNLLLEAFTLVDPESVKKIDNFDRVSYPA